MGANSYPSTVVAMVALIPSFGANSGRTGGGGGEKDTNKPDAIVSLHQADDSNDNPDDYDDYDESDELIVKICLLQMDPSLRVLVS